MTERFNANAEGATISTSGTGPSGSGGSLTALGLGQGPGLTANQQENNYFAQFEYPIRWDEVSGALTRLDDKKKLDEFLDDMTIRDQILEDYLNTNVVNGIVAGSRITINRAAGVVTITAANQLDDLAAGTNITITVSGSTYTIAAVNQLSNLAAGSNITITPSGGTYTIAAAAPAWTAWTPTVLATGGQTPTVTNNSSAWVRIGSIVHVRVTCTLTLTSSGYPTSITNLPVTPKVGLTSLMLGSGLATDPFVYRKTTTANTTAELTYDGVPPSTTSTTLFGIMTYEAA